MAALGEDSRVIVSVTGNGPVQRVSEHTVVSQMRFCTLITGRLVVSLSQ